MSSRRSGWALLVASSLVVLLAATRPAAAAPGAGKLAVGSKNFTENRLLAEIMAQLIEAHTDLEVERRVNLGGTKMVFSALESGEIDFYPEYTGTGWSIQLKIRERVDDPLRAYLHVQQEFRRRFDIEWLLPFGFNNSYALAMSDEAAERLGVTRISDLKAHQHELRMGVSHEFLNRPDGYPGLSQAYGLEIDELRGMDHGLAYEAIRTGRIDVVDTWTTDGKLLRYRIRILEDDQRFFPPYDAAPIVRAATLERHPRVGPLLNRLGFRLDDAAMRQLNYRVEELGHSFEQIAHEFLRDQHLLGLEPTAAAEASAPVRRRGGLLQFLWSQRGATLDLIAEHLLLTLAAVLLAIAVAVPLGIALTRWRPLVPPVLGAAGVIQTIPSLALLAFMIPLPGLGLGARSAIAALFLYALLPIVRNTYTGIKEIDPDLLEAARGMGLKDREVLTKVELPLATRTIMAGIRTSTVISIGVATLAAFIGAGGLGEPIITGLQLDDINLILSGALPAAALAVVVDFALGRVERVLVPRGIR
jgi:osmoprotectant transport system permease protein